MILVFYFFAVVLILLSLKSLYGGFEYLRFFKDKLAKPSSQFTPFATVIAPCRGLDDGLAENLRAIVEQDYPHYEVIFVVDDETDETVPVISDLLHRRDAETQRNEAGAELESDELNLIQTFNSDLASLRLCGEKLVSSKLIVAGKADGCSQKVENLREAVLYARPESQAFVFVDSDVRPSSNWLKDLIAPLEDESVGAATGYRWFISKQPSFGSEMRSVWNASIASALGPNTNSNFCWGGSMAIRRDVFEKIDMRGKWLGTLSDDFAVTRRMNELQRPIVFVPQAVTASVENCTFGEMLEFTARQMKITRVYAPPLWLLSFFGSGLFNAVMIAALLIVIFSRGYDLAFFGAVATLVIVSVCSIGKAWQRLNAVRLVLTQYEPELRRQLVPQNVLWILTPLVFFYNAAAASVSRQMTWRGTRYRLKSPTETVIIAD